MKLWPSRPVPYAAEKLKAVELSYSDGSNWQENRVTVRTVTYNMSGLSSSSYGLMYRTQPAVRAAVDFLSRNIAQLNPKVYERLSNTDRLEVGDHPLAVRLRNPNPATTRYAHLRDTVADLAIFDRAYWRKIRSGSDVFVVRIPPNDLTAVKNADGRVIYRLPDGTELVRDDLVLFAGYNPDGGEGVSPLETLRRVLAEEDAAVSARASMWNNSARPSGVLKRPADAPEWSATARDRFREEWESTYSGSANAGKTAILEEGMEYARDDFSAPVDDYIAARTLTYQEAAVAYGIPPQILGMTSTTAGGAEQSHRQVYQDVLGPWLRMLEDEIELQLLPEFEPLGSEKVYVEFNLKEKLRGAFEEEQRAITTGVGVPHMTINEGRARQNLPRINEKWADMPVQPLNVLYGGQPAVTVPTADPGTASWMAEQFLKAVATGQPSAEVSPPPKAINAPSTPVKSLKAPDAALRRRERAAKEHEELFRRHFERQEKAITSAKAVSDRERWDRELTADLFLLATQTTRKNGQLAAEQIGGVYDEKRTLAWLVENARITAENINAHTFEQIDAAESSEEVSQVFEVAKSSRSEQLGLGKATALIAFARIEAARHSEDADGEPRTKTWVVTSGKSRHPEMNGETVPVGEDFSNGMSWPGSPEGSADQTAGCHCLVRIN